MLQGFLKRTSILSSLPFQRGIFSVIDGIVKIEQDDYSEIMHLSTPVSMASVFRTSNSNGCIVIAPCEAEFQCIHSSMATRNFEKGISCDLSHSVLTTITCPIDRPSSKVSDTRRAGLSDVNQYAPLLQLSNENLKDCMELQMKMFKVMESKGYGFDFIRRRELSDFSGMIERGELFGVFDDGRKLIGIVSMAEMSREDIISHISSNSGELLVDPDMAKMLQINKGCYFSCLMTDLDRPRKGLGAYLMSSIGKVAERRGYAYSMGEIHVQNPASYRACTKIDAVSFAIANKTVSFINVKGVEVEIPVLYFVSFYDKTIAREFGNMFKNSEGQPFEYSPEIANSIMQSKGSDHDPILQQDEVIAFIDRRPFRVKLDLKLIKSLNDRVQDSSTSTSFVAALQEERRSKSPKLVSSQQQGGI